LGLPGAMPCPKVYATVERFREEPPSAASIKRAGSGPRPNTRNQPGRRHCCLFQAYVGCWTACCRPRAQASTPCRCFSCVLELGPLRDR
jgi:hypothetical protein